MFCVVPTIISGHIFNQAMWSPCDPTFTKERQAGLHQYKLVGQDQGPNLWSKHNKLNIRRWKYVQQQSQQICPNKIYAFHSCSEWIRCAATQKRNQHHQRVAAEAIVISCCTLEKQIKSTKRLYPPFWQWTLTSMLLLSRSRFTSRFTQVPWQYSPVVPSSFDMRKLTTWLSQVANRQLPSRSGCSLV